MSKYKPIYKACTPPFAATVLCFFFAAFNPIGWMTLVNFLLGIVFLLDTGARYREYVVLFNKGSPWTGRDIKYFRASYCRRWAAVQAGMDKQIFLHLGYRWWHILPDDFPQCLFRSGFWGNLLGIKRSSGSK